MSGSVRADDRGGHPCDGDPVPVRGAVKIFPQWACILPALVRACGRHCVRRGYASPDNPTQDCAGTYSSRAMLSGSLRLRCRPHVVSTVSEWVTPLATSRSRHSSSSSREPTRNPTWSSPTRAGSKLLDMSVPVCLRRPMVFAELPDLLIHRQTQGCAKLSIARGAHFLIWLFALAAVRRKLQIVSFG